MGIGIFGKRGIFFTFIAVMLMAALIIIFSPSTSINVANKPVVKTRVITLNDFVQDLENSYFIEAMRELRYEEGRDNVIFVNVAYICGHRIRITD